MTRSSSDLAAFLLHSFQLNETGWRSLREEAAADESTDFMALAAALFKRAVCVHSASASL